MGHDSLYHRQKTGPNPDLSQVDIETLFAPSKISSGGYGIIDVNWRDEQNVWAVGGSGVIFESKVNSSSLLLSPSPSDFIVKFI